MVVEARVRVRHKGCFTEGLQGALHGAQLAGDRSSEVVVVHGAQNGQLEGLLDALRDAQARRPEVLDRSPGSVVLRVRGPTHSVVADIAAAGCTLLWPALFANGQESYTILAPSREDVDALVAKLAVHGSATLERVGDVQPGSLSVSMPLAEITAALTER